jgi:selenide, water dikinase
LAAVPHVIDDNVLVGFNTCDDAGVYRIAPDLALVQTVDFFTPIVDDPWTYGAISAANSLSDVYAMGGKPLTALSIVAYPANGDLDALEEILRGGAAKMAEAGCSIVGGHSVNDDEIKFGYAITGLVHPDRVKTNSGARPGDALVLTKRIGTGVVATALKRGIAAAADVEASTVSMLELSRAACERMLAFDVHGCTDVTGFGLIGHAREMAAASKVTLEIEADSVEFLPGALEYARQGAIAGGLKNNREFNACAVEKRREIPVAVEDLLHDPQTSGGLLVAMPESDAALFRSAHPGAFRIGRVLARQETPIRLI